MVSGTVVSEMVAKRITIVRIPSPKGPILRCQGHLTVETAEMLRRDLILLASAGHERVIVNLNGVRRIDADGILALVEPARQNRACAVMLVATAEPALGYLHLTGVDRILPVFASEQAALTASVVPSGPSQLSADEARVRVLAQWERLRAELGVASPDEIAEKLNGVFLLCKRADAEGDRWGHVGLDREHYCPLISDSRGQTHDQECARVLNELLGYAQRCDWPAMAAAIERIEERIRTAPCSA